MVVAASPGSRVSGNGALGIATVSCLRSVAPASQPLIGLLVSRTVLLLLHCGLGQRRDAFHLGPTKAPAACDHGWGALDWMQSQHSQACIKPPNASHSEIA